MTDVLLYLHVDSRRLIILYTRDSVRPNPLILFSWLLFPICADSKTNSSILNGLGISFEHESLVLDGTLMELVEDLSIERLEC
jgi:hypothetical protein